jgi:putative phage-type endonuclease
MPIFVPVEPNSPEWLKARCGYITASRIVDVISYLTRKSKNGEAGDPSGDRIKYLKELRGERTTGRATEKYVSKYMDHGNEYEGVARAAYEAAFDAPVQRVGFVIHSELDFSGATPDALVGDDGLLEIKCPQIETHYDYRETGVVPEQYETQMMWGMEVCGRKWCDFVSFHPDAPEDLRIFVVRLEYDPERAKYLREEVIKFNAEIEESIARLRGKSGLNDKLRQSLEAV